MYEQTEGFRNEVEVHRGLVLSPYMFSLVMDSYSGRGDAEDMKRISLDGKGLAFRKSKPLYIVHRDIQITKTFADVTNIARDRLKFL